MDDSQTSVPLQKILKEYKPDSSLFSEDTPEIYRLKKAVFDLDEAHKRVMVMYAELGSQRQLAKALGVSPATVNHLVSEIRTEIIKNYGIKDFQKDFERWIH